MSDTVMMAEMAWPDYAAHVKRGAPVFLPIGATEQHGPHMALSVDVILPQNVAERVARQVGGIVAPPVTYGYRSQPRSGGGEAFPGTISLDAQTMALVIRDIICGFAKDGVRKMVLMPGHFENIWPVIEGITLALRELRRDGIEDMTILRLEYWDFVSRDVLDQLFPEGFPGTELEHAALLETSAMLLVRPDLVNMAKVPSDGPAVVPGYDRYPRPAGTFPASGALARAERSSEAYGKLLFDEYSTRVTAAVKEGLAL